MVQIKDLRMGCPAPNFRLSSTAGNMIELRNYRHRQPVVLFFLHNAACKVCHTRLVQFQECCADYQAENVAVISIMPTSATNAHMLAQRLRLSFVVLPDPDRKVYKTYGVGDEQAGLFVLDRYNGQQIAEITTDARELMSPNEALQWAVFSETTCPECGVLEWPESG